MTENIELPENKLSLQRTIPCWYNGRGSSKEDDHLKRKLAGRTHPFVLIEHGICKFLIIAES